MEEKTCVTAEDLDKQSITIKNNKLIAIGSGEDTNTIQFTDNVIVFDTTVNGIQFVFREIDQSKNPSNKLMLCTGIKFKGKWVGDSPKNENSTDPFNVPAEPEGLPSNNTMILVFSSDYFKPELTMGESVSTTYTLTSQNGDENSFYPFSLDNQFDTTYFNVEVSTDSSDIEGLEFTNNKIVGSIKGVAEATITVTITPTQPASDVRLNGFGSSILGGTYTENLRTQAQGYLEEYADEQEITIS